MRPRLGDLNFAADRRIIRIRRGGFAPDWHIQAQYSAQGMHSDSETNPDSTAHAAVTSGHGQAAAGGPVSGGRRLAPTTASLMSRLRL